MLKRALLTAALLTAGATLAACGSDEKATDSAADPGANDATSAATSTSPTATAETNGQGGACTYTPDGTSSDANLPPSTPTKTGKVPVTITSSVGDLKLTLDADKAPCTVNSFVSLAKQGFWDGSYCHRMSVADGFTFLQCGDPTATSSEPAQLAQAGRGGPGYTIPDEVDGTEAYPAGAVAMANTGQPDTGGSQFFLVFGQTDLPPSYTVFATMDAATVKTLQGVGAAGVAVPGPDGSGPPTKAVEFEKVTIG